MVEVAREIEWAEAVADKTGHKMRLLKDRSDQEALDHIDQIQKKSIYTRLKKNLLDMSWN